MGVLSWQDRRETGKSEEGAEVGVFDRLLRRQRSRAGRAGSNVDTEYLEQWATSRRGVEAYVEPRTTVTDITVVLVAHDGEWTRRGVGSGAAATRLGKRLRIPVYDVAKMGYPQRMRDYTARRRILRKRAEQPDRDGDGR